MKTYQADIHHGHLPTGDGFAAYDMVRIVGRGIAVRQRWDIRDGSKGDGRYEVLGWHPRFSQEHGVMKVKVLPIPFADGLVRKKVAAAFGVSEDSVDILD